MYKLKTNRSICKRFKVTSNSKLLRRNSSRSHLLQKKSSKRKRQLRKINLVSSCDRVNFINKVPYLN